MKAAQYPRPSRPPLAKGELKRPSLHHVLSLFRRLAAKPRFVPISPTPSPTCPANNIAPHPTFRLQALTLMLGRHDGGKNPCETARHSARRETSPQPTSKSYALTLMPITPNGSATPPPNGPLSGQIAPTGPPLFRRSPCFRRSAAKPHLAFDFRFSLPQPSRQPTSPLTPHHAFRH